MAEHLQRVHNARSEGRNALFLFLITLLCAVYVFPRWADPNQNSRLDMVVALVEDGTFRIDRFVSNTVDYARVGDHYYSDKAPGAAFLAVPLYAGLYPLLQSPALTGVTDRLAAHEAFAATLRADGSGVSAGKVRFALAQVALSLWVAAIPTALLAALLYLAAARLVAPAWPRVAVALGYALMTPAYAYANAFYGHQLAAALLFGAFCLALWMPGGTESALRSALRLVGIGALLAFSVVTEYPAVLPAAVIAVYCAWQLWQSGEALRFTYPSGRRSRLLRLLGLGWAAGAGGVVMALWMLYNAQIFGAPLELGYRYSELWAAEHGSGFMSLSGPSAEALWGITFSPFRGLFLLAPWLLLALPGYLLWFRSGLHSSAAGALQISAAGALQTSAAGAAGRAEWFVSAGCVAVMFAFNGSSGMWWGGFAVGPRYLLPALPFLALPVVFVLARGGQERMVQVVAALLALWSLAAVWGMTLAEQAFPPDTMANPWTGHLLPNWQAGNLARNVGTVLGLQGAASLLPLAGSVAGLLFVWVMVNRRAAGSGSLAEKVASLAEPVAVEAQTAHSPSVATCKPQPQALASFTERKHAG